MNSMNPQPPSMPVPKKAGISVAAVVAIIVSVAVMGFTLLLFLPSLLFESKPDATCVNMKTDTALSVKGVVSVKFTCQKSFEGSVQHGSVVVNATTTEDAVKIMDAVYVAFAVKEGMGTTWTAPTEFTSEDGSIAVNPRALGFNGTPTISDLRTHYNVHANGD